MFSTILDKPTFRYLSCGGVNTALDLILFSTAYNYIFQGKLIQIGVLAVSPHIASLFFSLFVTIPTGFLLSKYIVFQAVTNNKIQFLKYIIIVTISLIANYVLMKIFVEQIHIIPLISKICTNAIVAIFSYFSQKKFTFKR
jgi:putative flippase GtrA